MAGEHACCNLEGMVALLLAAALSVPAVVPHHHVSLHVGHQLVVNLHTHARINGWSMTPSLLEVHSRWKKKVQLGYTLLGLIPGTTMFTVRCDGGPEEEWLVDVLP